MYGGQRFIILRYVFWAIILFSSVYLTYLMSKRIPPPDLGRDDHLHRRLHHLPRPDQGRDDHLHRRIRHHHEIQSRRLLRPSKPRLLFGRAPERKQYCLVQPPPPQLRRPMQPHLAQGIAFPPVQPPALPPTPDGPHSRAAMVRDLKKTADCGEKRLYVPGMVGPGALVSGCVIVSKDGSGDFYTIQEAVEAVPESSRDGYFVIYIARGVYEEYIDINLYKKYILMLGDGIDQTIITGNRSARDYGTSPSATFSVAGEGFTAIDITFRNTFGEGSQAVAMRSTADKSAFFRCRFDGFQDTLLVDAQRQFYRDCDVYGTIDFIFGQATVVFQNCRILPRLYGQSKRSGMLVAAHNRKRMDETTGISFHNCTLNATQDLAEEVHRQRDWWPVLLGRPWGPYARTVYMESYIGEMYNQTGWLRMNGGENKGLYFGEFRNHGPGADTSGRVGWKGVRKAMTAQEAMWFTVENFIDGCSWLPQTSIPFHPDLIHDYHFNLELDR